MKRRQFCKTLGIAAGALCTSVFSNNACKSSSRMKQPPNILFIMADDHAAAAISAYKGFLSSVIRTPNIDLLAKEGMLFKNCFVTNSICTPSRASILTGKYSHKNGCRTLNDVFDNTQLTFPKLLQKAGYYTAIIGKWHLKSEPTGFDYYNVLPGQGRYFDPHLIEKGIPWQRGRKESKQYKGYVTDIITDIALEHLKNRPQNKPFCFLVHHKAPHDMWEYDKKHAHLYEDIEIPEPENLFDDYQNRGEAIKRATQKIDMEETLFLHKTQGHQFDNVRAKLSKLPPREQKRRAYQIFIKAYLRCVASIDENVGRLLDYLDEANLAENTIVVYTSDQGVFLGEHGLFDKRFMYEESIRMPLLVRFPKEIEPGSINNDIVLNIDFAETFLDYAGLPIPSEMQGQSLRPLFQGKKPKNWRNSMYYRYWMHRAHFNVAAHYGIRTNRYKLIFYYGLPLDANGAIPEPTPPEWELFDLENDPNEMRNVYHDPAYANIVKQLKTELLHLKVKFDDKDDKYPELIKIRNQIW